MDQNHCYIYIVAIIISNHHYLLFSNWVFVYLEYDGCYELNTVYI